MEEIAEQDVATCYCDELHELLSRYKKQLPHSQIILTTHSAIKEELELCVKVNSTILSAEMIKSTSTEALLKELKDRNVIRSWYYNGTYHVGNEV